jgi:hypothetical protein
MNHYLCLPLRFGVVIFLLAPAAVFAQTPAAPRGPQGLFGGVQPDARANTRLDFGLSFVEGYDQDIPTTLVGSVDANSLQSGGYTTMLNASANYAWRRNRTEIAANGASAIRHDSELGATRNAGHSAGLGFNTRLGGRTTLYLNQSASYSPTYLYALFPTDGALVPGDARTASSTDFNVSTQESYVYETKLSMKHELTPRRRFEFGGEYTYTDRLQESDGWTDIDGYGVNGGYTQQVARNTGVGATVRYHSGTFGYFADGTSTEIGADFNVDYQRPLSATRRLSLRLGIGVSGTDIPQQVTTEVGLTRQYRGTVDATVGYQFGRSWQARLNVRRGVEYMQDLPTPVFAQGASASIDGLLSRRTDLSASVGYSTGESILNREGLIFDTYAARLKMRFALSRNWAAYGEYLYYYYDFRGGLQLLPGIPNGLERNGARAGLTLWVPALRR